MEALTWIGTPFRFNACVKDVGVDCGRFPHAVYAACGIDCPAVPHHWPRDFMCHNMADTEPYVALVSGKFSDVTTPLPGDLALFMPNGSRCYSHAAIVTDWPRVIHARGIGSRPKVECASGESWPLAGSPVRFFSPFASNV